MGARDKLNIWFFFGAVLAATLIGGFCNSWAMFALAFCALLALAVGHGGIRPPRNR